MASGGGEQSSRDY